MHRPGSVFNLLALLVFTFAFTPATSAQSSDRDHPTPLKSNEIEGDLDASGNESFYSFTAGPGELTITVDVKSSDGTAVLEFELLDSTASKSIICCEFAQADSAGKSGRNIKSVKLAKRQTVVLHLTVGKTGTGTYRVRLGGAVAAGGSTASGDNQTDNRLGLPTSGILRLEMSDGTTQEINLSRVRRVTIKP
jgi:hypothetical protein